MSNRFIKRPLSYSQLSSWEWNKEDWYQSYIKNKPRGKSAAMEIGNVIGDSIGTPQSLVPDLNPPGIKEYALRATLGDIHLVGYCDHFCPDTLELNENKTAVNPKKWTKSSVNKHGQLTMYALMLFLKHDIAPEDLTIYLNYIRVIEGADMRYYLPDPVECKRFKTTRTTQDIIDYVEYIERTVADMNEYVALRLSTDVTLPTPEEVVI